MVGLSLVGAEGAAAAWAPAGPAAAVSLAPFSGCTGFVSREVLFASGLTSTVFLAARRSAGFAGLFTGPFSLGVGAAEGFPGAAGGCAGVAGAGVASTRGARITRTPLISDP